MTAEELRELLERADCSQVRLARELGVAPHTVWRWCSLKDAWPIPDSRVETIRALLVPCPTCGRGMR